MKTIKQAADALLSRGEITKDEYKTLEKSSNFEKEANAKMIADSFRQWVFPAAAAGALAVAGKELIYDPIKRNIDVNKSFDLMSKKVPQLAEKDPEDMKDYFNVIKTFSPKAASNPLVAGALVNKMMEFGGVDHKLVQDIASIESGLQRPSIIQSATEAAAKTISSVGKDDSE